MPVMPIYWYTYPNLESESRQGHVQHQPAQPDRPDQGRRHRVGRSLHERGRGSRAPRPRSAILERRVGERSMLKFIVRRIFWTIPVLLVVIFLTFMMMRQIEGNPFRQHRAAGARGGAARTSSGSSTSTSPGACSTCTTSRASPRSTSARRSCSAAETSTTSSRTHFPNSIELGVYAFLFAIIVGVPLGMIAALRQNTWVDYTAMFFSNVFHAIPSFLVATLLIYFVALKARLVTDERLDELGAQDPARDRARLRADGALRAARARHDARDAAAGLRPHGAGEGPALPARRRPARAPELADPGDHRGRPAARLHHHGLVRDRADLQHPRASASTTSRPSTRATTPS